MKLYTLNQFEEKANKIHNNRYDYRKFLYVNSRIKGIIICKKHNVEFFQTPQAHLRGCGCRICAVQDVSCKKYTTEFFIKRATKIHGDTYDYSLSVYLGGKIKVEIICKIHGIFKQTPYSHIINENGCPICKLSKNEIRIKKFLDDNNIKYIQQKRFDTCRGAKYPLPFDFYLPDYNICIEYDGEQHYNGFYKFKNCEEKDKDFKIKVKNNDIIKTNYCKNNNIKLIRIPYWDKNKIEKILSYSIINTSEDFNNQAI